MQQDKKKRSEKIFWGIITAIVSLIIVVVYRVSLGFVIFPYVMWGYMIALTVLVAVYVIYNRGFTRRGVEIDMLPDDWDHERRVRFVEDGKKRYKRSKWMLTLIIGFLFTFLVDALELFLINLL